MVLQIDVGTATEDYVFVGRHHHAQRLITREHVYELEGNHMFRRYLNLS
jgi:hypothetical protein